MIQRILLWVIIIAAVVFVAVSILFPTEQPPKYTGPVEKVTIAYAKESLASLVLIAEKKGFFSQYGVDVTIKEFKGGKQALMDGLLAGEADMATAADIPIVANSFDGQDFRIVSVIGKSDNEPRIIARRDSGITEPKDLLGKRIGTKSSSAVHFFLHAFLLNSSILIEEIDLRFEVDGDKLVDLLVNNEIDAISHREPFIGAAKRLLGDNTVLFEGAGLYIKTFSLVATNEFIKNNGVAVERVVRALVEAENFVKNNKDESISIIARELEIPKSDVEALWPEIDLALYLDQTFLFSLDEGARWMINNDLVFAEKIPNYLDFIYIDALDTVKPEVLTIIR